MRYILCHDNSGRFAVTRVLPEHRGQAVVHSDFVPFVDIPTNAHATIFEAVSDEAALANARAVLRLEVAFAGS